MNQSDCFNRSDRRLSEHQNQNRAFTLTELLVVIGTLAVLSVVLLPALAGSRAQPRVTACAANFRQWAVTVNLYANDHLDSLPRFDFAGGGGNFLWDVSTTMITNISTYGLTVPMWYDPVRPDEFTTDDAKYFQNTGNHLNTVLDLQIFFQYYRGAQNYNECIIHQNWWVQRAGAGGVLFPTTYVAGGGRGGAGAGGAMSGPAKLYGFPKRLHDNATAYVPFISCEAGAIQASGTTGVGASYQQPPSANPMSIAINMGHFFNGVPRGVNAAYADGHVEEHLMSQMNCGYDQGTQWWFY